MRIAIVRLTALGDIINSLIVLQLIKRHSPNSTIEWVCEEIFAPVVENNPMVEAVRTISLKQLKKERSFALLKKTLKDIGSWGEYDLIIDMQGLIKSSIISRLIGANIHGYDFRSARESVASFFYKSKSSLSYEMNSIERNCNLVANALNFDVEREEILNKSPLLFYRKEEFKFKPSILIDRKNIVFAIGSSWPSKNYPKERFAQVANSLSEANILTIWGDAKEREDGEWIAKECGNVTLLPHLDFNDLKALISRVDLTIGNDTGPTHMAWAMNRPSITLFGPTPVERVFQTPINRAIKSHSSIDHYKLNRSDFSIREIDPKSVSKAARELLYEL